MSNFGMNVRGNSAGFGNMSSQAMPIELSLSAIAQTYAPIILPSTPPTQASELASSAISPAILNARELPTLVSSQFTDIAITTPVLANLGNIPPNAQVASIVSLMRSNRSVLGQDGVVDVRLDIGTIIPAGQVAGILDTGDIANTRGIGTIIPASQVAGLMATAYKIPAYQPIQPRQLSPDSLNISDYSLSNNLFQPIPLGGISSFRPEIIGLVDFNKFYGVGLDEYSASGKLAALNFESKILRENTLEGMITALKTNTDADSVFQTYEAVKTNKLSEIQNSLDFFNANIQQINNIKKAFEIKYLPRENYDTSKFLTMEEFFESRMKYSRRAYAAFSDTKVLYQTLFDFRSIMEKYSLSLLNSTDSDRGDSDLDPIKIDKTYTDGGSFTFSVASNQGKLAFRQIEFNAFENSLPSSPDDKLKLLFATIAKELRVSRGLSKPTVRTLLTTFFGGSPDGNPFDNIVGSVGNDIFETPQGTNSLASLFQFQGGNSVTVLPFEKKTVDDNQTSFVPGTRYFIDSILQLDTSSANPRFNTGPLNDFVQRYSEVLANAKLIINELFQFTSEAIELQTDVVFIDFLLAIKQSVDTVLSGTDSVNTDQLLFLALFRMATQDTQLKLMLFQYVILLGLASNDDRDQKRIFTKFGQELKELRGLSFVKVDDSETPNIFEGMGSLSPYLRQLAQDIETRVLGILNQNTPSQKVDVSRKDSSRLEPGSSKAATEFSSTRQPQTTASNSGTPKRGFPLRKTSHKLQSEATTTGSETTLELQAITNALGYASRTTLSNLVKEFIEFAHKLDTAASIAGNDRVYVLGSDSDSANATLTRFNQLSASTLLLMIYELFITFVSKYFGAEFKQTQDAARPAIIQDQTKNEFIISVINQLTTTRLVNADIISSGVRQQTRQNLLDQVTPAVSADDIRSLNLPRFPLAANSTAFGGLNAASLINNPADSAADTDNADALANEAGSVPAGRVVKKPSRKITGRTGAAGQAVSSVNNTPNHEPTVRLSDAGIGTISALGNTSVVDTNFLKNLINQPAFYATLAVYKDSLKDIQKKLADEDRIVQNIIHLFDVIGDNLARVKNQSLAYFSAASQNDIIKITGIGNRLVSSQVRTANWLFQQNKKTLDTRSGFNLRVVTPDDWNTMQSLLREPIYTSELADKRTKLLIVGVPFGFTEKLVDRVARSTISDKSNFEQSIEADLVNITVWKRSAEDDDVVFYPQKFTFDLSLYSIAATDVQIDPSISFDSLITQLALQDFSSDIDANQLGTSLNLNQINSDARWSVLNQEGRTKMFKNHIVSYLLAQHTYLTTGLRVTEDAFPINNYNINWNQSENSPEVNAIINAYLTLVKNLSQEQSAHLENLDFTDRSIAASIKDDVRILKGSSGLQLDLIQQKVLSPKKFDRVFTIPINIDSFVINAAETTTTISGKTSFGRNSFQRRLQTLNPQQNQTDLLYIDRSKEPNALIFEEYFVTIETVR